MPATSWSLDGLEGEVSDSGAKVDPRKIVNRLHIGYVVAKLGDLEAKAQVRAAGPLPWKEDFESAARRRLSPRAAGPRTGYGRSQEGIRCDELEGGKVLECSPTRSSSPRGR